MVQTVAKAEECEGAVMDAVANAHVHVMRPKMQSVVMIVPGPTQMDDAGVRSMVSAMTAVVAMPSVTVAAMAAATVPSATIGHSGRATQQ